MVFTKTGKGVYNKTMPKKTPKKELVPALSQEQMESGNLELDSKNLETQAREQLSPDLLRKVKKISYYTSENGLTLEEACLLADINFVAFKELIEANSLVRKIILVKELQYKKDLLFTVSQKAREGDDKLALWLLERKYPEEFQALRKGSHGAGSGDEDLLVQAIEYIQKTGDTNPLVKETSIRAIVIKKKKDPEEIIQKLSDILA